MFFYRQQRYAEFPEVGFNSSGRFFGWDSGRTEHSLASSAWDHLLFKEDTFATLFSRFVNFPCKEPSFPALFIETYSYAFGSASAKTSKSCNNRSNMICFFVFTSFLSPALHSLYNHSSYVLFVLIQIHLYVWQ